MVMERNLVKVGNREVKKRYIGNKLIFEDLGDKTEIISGEEIFTDQADDSVVHVEVDGKSYQEDEPSPDNPSEIHSVNDFDVVSSVGGRNLLLNSEKEHSSSSTIWSIDILGSKHRPMVEGQEYTLSFDLRADSPTLSYRFFLNNSISIWRTFNFGTEWKRDSVTFTFKENDYQSRQIHPHIYPSGSMTKYMKNFKLEKGNIATDWTPSPADITENDNHPLIDKINLSLSEPLRSVGDVKDRLFRDSDGLWKVERNVEVTGTEDGTQSVTDAYSPYDVPVIEVLSEEYQNKLSNLRSFQDSNYVYTISNTDILPDYVVDNLKPNLHTTFKSKGWYDYYLKTLLK